MRIRRRHKPLYDRRFHPKKGDSVQVRYVRYDMVGVVYEYIATDNDVVRVRLDKEL